MPVKNNLSHRQKIKYRIRKRVNGTPERPRLVVFRSLNNIYVQVVDDLNSKTLLSMSSHSKEVEALYGEAKNKVSKSKVVGQVVAKKALELNIKKAVFDRNGYLYHGRVRAVADGARESGLEL